jgi:hypothetical protein
MVVHRTGALVDLEVVVKVSREPEELGEQGKLTAFSLSLSCAKIDRISSAAVYLNSTVSTE